MSCLNKDETEKFFNEYIERDTYYYNVVHFLDGYLYAFGEFRDEFLPRLTTGESD